MRKSKKIKKKVAAKMNPLKKKAALKKKTKMGRRR